MDFTKGYSSSYRIVKVDAASWTETEAINRVTSVSITHDIDSKAPRVDSADLEVDSMPMGECYVRVYMDCRQNGSRTSVPLGTFLLESTGSEGGAFSTWSTAEMWSVLKPADERILPVGWHAQKGVSSVAKAAELISECCEAPVIYDDGGPSLADNVVAEDDESYLKMAWTLLDDDWVIVPDGYGRIRIFKDSEIHAIEPSEIIGTISEDWDLADIPNTITVTEKERTATATNNDPDSPTSTVARGRIINGDGSGRRKSNETLNMFARRLLKEQSKVTRTASYKREYRTDILCGSFVTLPNKEGVWRVITQSVDCKAGATVEETVERIEETWQ